MKLILCLFSAGLLAMAQEPAAPAKAADQGPMSDPANPAKWNDDPLNTPRFPSKDFLRKRFENPSTQVELRDPMHLEDYVQSDKLTLSLKNYIDLVMANNTDVEIQRISVQLQRNAITRAFARCRRGRDRRASACNTTRRVASAREFRAATD